MSKYRCKNEPALLVHWVQEHSASITPLGSCRTCAQIPALQHSARCLFPLPEALPPAPHPTPPHPSLALSHTHTTIGISKWEKGGEVCVWSTSKVPSPSCGCGCQVAVEQLNVLCDFSPHKLPHYFPWPFLCCSVAAVGQEPTAQPLWQHSVLRDLWSILDVSKHTVSLSNCSLFIRNQCMVEKF